MITRNHLIELQEKAQKLEPNRDQMTHDGKLILDYVKQFYEGIYESPSWVEKSDLSAKLLDFPFTNSGYGIESTLKLFKEEVDESGLNAACGGHLGYIPGGGIFHSAMADVLADVTNEYAGHFFASPGAVRVENQFLRWLMEITGFPSNAVGNLTSGGSIANLIGITAARDHHEINSTNVRKSVIYTSELLHHCNHKAIRISGLNECVQRTIPVDNQGRIISYELERIIQEDQNNDLKPFLIIASAGTTDLGSIDPLNEIADICQSQNCWFHVDAAYGGFFVLTEEGKAKLNGIKRADSLVMDPHKGLFIPYGLGAVLIKNKEALMKSHHYQASYMQDTFDANDEISPADVSPELTKHFRGLRAWMPLMINGVEPFEKAAEEKLALCKYFYKELDSIEGIEKGPEPELSVCAFRFVSKNMDADKFNLELCKLIKLDGRVFLSSTTINRQVFIRFACLSIRTHLETVDTCLKVIKEKILELEKAGLNA